MTDINKTYLLMISDRSGSMDTVREEAEKGINAFFADQATQPGECHAMLVQFDASLDTVFEDTPVTEVPQYKLTPRGMTALLDAVGMSMTRLGEKLAAMPEEQRPGSVIVGIMSDGHENSSKEWAYPRVQELVTQQREQYGWQITFMGANIDAVAVGATLGVRQADSLTFAANNIAETMDSYSGHTKGYRMSRAGGQSIAVASAAAAWTPEERAEAMKDKGSSR